MDASTGARSTTIDNRTADRLANDPVNGLFKGRCNLTLAFVISTEPMVAHSGKCPKSAIQKSLKELAGNNFDANIKFSLTNSESI